MWSYTGLGFMTLVTVTIIIAMALMLYVAIDSHPDKSPDPDTWIVRATDASGMERLISTHTTNLGQAQGVVDSLSMSQEITPHALVQHKYI